VGLAGDSFQQRSSQSGLADAGFTREQYNLTLATLRFLPATQKDFEFVIPPNKYG
jgi:hypothetical protein